MAKIPISKKLRYQTNLPKIIFFILALTCLTPFIAPPEALLLGFLIAQVMEHPFKQFSHKMASLLLKISVVGLGFGMNIYTCIQAGKEGFLFTVVSILSILVLGAVSGKWMKIENKTSFLISAGTAICGGSAIAALSPVMKAEERQISVALGTVFILNAVALFIFPALGNAFHLSQKQFGLWCAIAIHDTSSVTGAAARYGTQALQMATAVKLARALWIIPVAFGAALLFKTGRATVKIPYFIGLFILAALANTCLPVVRLWTPYLTRMAEGCLTLTLFLIGSGLSIKTIRSVGLKPLLQGALLWLIISLAALYAVLVWVP